MRRAHLLRWRPRQPAQRGSLTLAWAFVSAHLASGCGSPILGTPRRLPSGAASQLDPSHRSSRFSPTGSWPAPITWFALALLLAGLAPAVLAAAPREAEPRLDPRQLSALPSYVQRVEPAIVGLQVEVP